MDRNVARRLVRSGDLFTSEELARGEVELEEVDPDPDPPPEEDQVEPWGLHIGSVKHRRFRHRLHEYRERYHDND